MKSIDVSVVMAVKNEEIHIEEAIQSVLLQQGLSCEIIVIDDGSIDQTFSIALKAAQKNKQITLYRNPKSGKCSAFNYGVSLAKGRFTCIFAGDDIMPFDSLAARLAAISMMPDNTAVVGLCKLTTMSEVKRLNGHLIPKAVGRGALSGVSPLMNRLALSKIFPVPELLPNEDTWMELAVIYLPQLTIIHSDVVGCNWRIHSGNSINMLVGFSDYNRKITSRLRAYSLFYDIYSHSLDEVSRCNLLAKVNCENSRSAGDLFGVLRSRVGLIDKLRSLSISNKFFYEIRCRLYGLLSGF